MPKRFSIQPSLALQDVKRCSRGAKAPVVRRHWPIIWLLAHGRTADQGAASTGDRVKGIRTVAPRYNQNGPAGLGDLRQRNPGQPGLLSAAPRQALATALDRQPLDGGLWTGPNVAAWMAATLGRPVHPQRGWEMRRRLGVRPNVPRPRHAKADPAAQAAFQKSSRRSSRRRSRPTPGTSWSCGRQTTTASGSRPACGVCGAAAGSGLKRSSSTVTNGAPSMPSCRLRPAGACGGCCPPSRSRRSRWPSWSVPKPSGPGTASR
jgi:transposase